MAVCPKCKYKLKVTDISQNCPKCGTNLMFFGFAERFYREAKYAEMDLASFRVWIAKVKAAFIGGKLQIARFCAVLLPVAALLAPLGTVTVKLPLFTQDINISGLGAIGILTDGTIGTILDFRQSSLLGASASAVMLTMMMIAVVVLLAVGILLTQILCSINLKRATKSLAALSAAGNAASVAAFLLTMRIPDFGSLITVSDNIFGLLCCVAAFSVIFALNVALQKKGIDVKYREGDLYRVEMLKRYKKHEITLEELPLPIYETDAERAERERKIEETAEMIAIAEQQGGKAIE